MTARSTLSWLMVCTLALLQGCGAVEEEWPINEESWAVHTVCGGPDTLPGVDVSKWQETVDWQSVKSDGIVFAFARVSDGLNYPDAFFSDNWTGMKQVGIIRGVYQYFRPSQDAVAQANYLIQEVRDAGGLEASDLPPVIDIEKTEGMSASDILAKVDQWLETIKHGLGRTPIIYTGSYFWDENIFSDSYASYPLWIPHYTTKECPLVPDPWQEWKIWQYTDSASVAGISGNADANRFNGTLTDLQAFIASSLVQPTKDAGMDGILVRNDQGIGKPLPDGDLPPPIDYDKDRPDDSGCALTGQGRRAGSPTALVMVFMLFLLAWGWRSRR